MDNTTSHREGVEKVAELVKDIRIAMLVTIDEQGRPNSRPMATQNDRFEGHLWFFTDRTSPKVTHILNNPNVNVVYADTGDESYLSLSGVAEMQDDRERIREMWNPFLKAWFEGPEDPVLTLIRVSVGEAEYWDTPGGKVASLIQLVKGAITGDGVQSDHGRVKL